MIYWEECKFEGDNVPYEMLWQRPARYYKGRYTTMPNQYLCKEHIVKRNKEYKRFCSEPELEKTKYNYYGQKQT